MLGENEEPYRESACDIRILNLIRLVIRGFRNKEDNRWWFLLSFCYYIGSRIFGLCLIFLSFSLYSWFCDKESIPWLSWVNARMGIIAAGTVVAFVQLGVITVLIVRASLKGCSSIRQVLFGLMVSFLRLLWFEWVILNLASLFVALSSVGLPNVTFGLNFSVGFCAISCIIQYIFFVRYYIKKIPIMNWTFLNTYVVTIPLTALFAATFFVTLIKYLHFGYIQTMQTWLFLATAFFFDIFGLGTWIGTYSYHASSSISDGK